MTNFQGRQLVSTPAFVLVLLEKLRSNHAFALYEHERNRGKRAHILKRIPVHDQQRGLLTTVPMRDSARSSLAELNVAACSATSGGIPAATHSSISCCTVVHAGRRSFLHLIP
ncbi:hypothetical protein BH18VER1_BH18VER1_04220 [soil metagenome]